MKKNFTSNPPVVIAGAGWAGLAAACKLTSCGYPVRLLEAAPTLGGRARSIQVNNKQLDNGQHIFLGAYKNMLELLDILGIPETDLFYRMPLDLKIKASLSTLHIRATRLPSPFHMLGALLTSQGLNWTEKLAISHCWFKIQLSGFRLEKDIPVLEFLKTHKQSDYIIKIFWEPLCVGALNTNIDQASMQIFLNVLKKSFTRSNRHSNILLAKKCLGETLPGLVAEFIRQNNGQVSTRERLLSINVKDGLLQSINTSKGEYDTERLILATPFEQTQKLLGPLPQQATVVSGLQQFSHEPIVTLYLQYPDNVSIEGNMLGFTDSLTQWLVDRKVCGQPGLIAAVVSANGKHMSMDKNTLVQTIISEINSHLPDWPKPLDSYLVREKHATFSCHYKINHLRPKNGNIGQNIWLAGDYTHTGLPATIEGAVMSGLDCALELIQTSAQD